MGSTWSNLPPPRALSFDGRIDVLDDSSAPLLRLSGPKVTEYNPIRPIWEQEGFSLYMGVTSPKKAIEIR